MLDLVVACFAIAPLLGPSSVEPSPVVSGRVLHVGPTQTYLTIGDAVLASAAGDLILVDPGVYPEFVVDRGVSIVAVGASFTVLETASSEPAILIRDVPKGEQVTVIGAHIDHGISFDTPAVKLKDNAGAVRLDQLDIRLTADLVGTVAHAALAIVNTATFWIHDSLVWTGAPKVAHRIPGTGYDEVVNGIEVAWSDGVIQNSRVMGYNGAPGTTYAGDAVRVFGNSSVWLVDDFYKSPKNSILRGGDGTSYGGNAIQLFNVPRSQRITRCGTVKIEGGSGTTQNGGYFAIEGDLGLVSAGSVEVVRLPTGCKQYELGETSVGSSTVPIGGLIDVRIWTAGGGPFITFASTGSSYTRQMRQFAGRSILDVFAPVVLNVWSGTLVQGGVSEFSVSVPNDTALIGTQLVFQSVTGALGSPSAALTFGSLVVLTP